MYKITKLAEDRWAAEGNGIEMIVDDGRAFQRVGIKNVGAEPDADGNPTQYEVRWLVGEIDGVRAYLAKNGDAFSIVMTKRDIYP